MLFRSCLPEPASAIRFAVEFGCEEILPAAFYQLARTSIGDDWDAPYRLLHCPARWSLLTGDDFHRYVLGCARLRGMLVRQYDLRRIEFLVRDFVGTECDSYDDGRKNYRFILSSCEDMDDDDSGSTVHPCLDTIQEALSNEFGLRRLVGDLDPLAWYLKCLDYKKSFVQIGYRNREEAPCPDCHERLLQYVTKQRRDIWDSLKDTFSSGRT